MSAAVGNLAIVVPVHAEDGWTAASPEGATSVRARLEASSLTFKSAEELKAAEERAVLLRELHLEAVRMRATRENERAKETVARRNRIANEHKDKLQARIQSTEQKVHDRKEAIEKLKSERLARRAAFKEAFEQGRAEHERASRLRAAAEAARMQEAGRARVKILQSLIVKNAYEVKHAIAVAAAAKEKLAEEAKMAVIEQQARHAAAAARRIEKIPASPPSASPATPKVAELCASEQTSEHLPSARARSRGVAHALNNAAVSMEEKRKACDEAMAKASSLREAQLETTLSKAGAYREKARLASEAREAREAAIGEARAELVSKMQGAEVRRLLHLRSAAKPAAPTVIIVDVAKAPGATAPAGLIQRLSAKGCTLITTSAARFAAAAARKDAKLAKLRVRMSTRDVNHARAVARRARCVEAKRTKASQASTAASAAYAFLMLAKIAKAEKFNGRVAAAAARRATSLEARKVRAATLYTCEKAAAASVLAARFVVQYQRQEQIYAFEARCTARLAVATALASVNAERHALASERRTVYLKKRVAKAQISAMKGGTAAKLTTFMCQSSKCVRMSGGS